MSSDKVRKAVELVEQSFMTLDDAAKQCGISQVYFRRIVEGMETPDQPMKSLIFGKQVISRDDVEFISAKLESNRTEREAKRDAKLQEQLNKVSEPKGPTLLDLKLEARELAVPVGRKNKAELIAALEAKRNELTALEDVAVDEQAADQEVEDPALTLEAVMTE